MISSLRRLWLLWIALAISLIPVSVGVSQDDGESLFLRAQESFSDADYDSARALFERYVRENSHGSRSAQAAFLIGECYFRTRQYTMAVFAFGNAYQQYGRSPQAAQILEGLGRAKLGLGLVQEAVEHFKAAQGNSPTAELRRDINSRLSEIFYNLGNYDEAKEALVELAGQVREPDVLRELQLKLADCYYRTGGFEEAEELFRQFIGKDRQFFIDAPELSFRWGEILLFVGKVDEAREVLRSLLSGYGGHAIQPHVVMRLGDLERLESAGEEEPSQRAQTLRKAVGYYRRLLPVEDTDWENAGAESRILAGAATLRILEAADSGGLDLAADFELPPAEALVERLLQAEIGAETKALALFRLSRHLLMIGREREALQGYKRLITDYPGARLAVPAKAEHSLIARRLMTAFFERADFNNFVDIYLVHGQELELSNEDKLNLAESYAHVQMYDNAEQLFTEVLGRADDSALARRCTLGLARLELGRGEHDSALKRLNDFTKLDIPAEDRETAMLLVLDSLFEKRDLAALRDYWIERTGQLNTLQLRATAIFKLGVLAKLNGLLAEATELFERFILEFAKGIPGNLRIYGYLADARIALGDLYYESGQWRTAAGQYQLFIALYGDSRDLAWPLFQSANCHLRLNEVELAIAVYEELIRLYPDSIWSSQAKVDLEEVKRAANSGNGR